MLNHPIERGIINNWDDMEKTWLYIQRRTKSEYSKVSSPLDRSFSEQSE